jgi:hypothetical protein
MRVKCINDSNLINPQNSTLLTIGKWYDLLEVETDYNSIEPFSSSIRRFSTIYWIIDDTGCKRFFEGNRFDPNPHSLRRMGRLGELGV